MENKELKLNSLDIEILINAVRQIYVGDVRKKIEDYYEGIINKQKEIKTND